MDIRFGSYPLKIGQIDDNIAHVALSTKTEVGQNSPIAQYVDKSTHKAILSASDLITARLKQSWHYQDRHNVQYAYKHTLFFRLRFYLHYWLLRICIIDAAIKEHLPERIYINNHQSFLPNDVSNEAEILSLIVRQCASNHGLNVEVVQEGECGDQHASKRSRKQLLALGIKLFADIMYRLQLPFLKKKKIVLVADDSYNMQSLIEKIKQKSGVSPIYLHIGNRRVWQHIKATVLGQQTFFLQNIGLPSARLTDALEEFSNFVLEDHNYFKGINLSPILSDYVTRFAGQQLGALELSIEKISKLIREVKPDMALSQHALGYSYALGEMCSMNEIPGLLITHGTHSPQKYDEYAKLEWSEHAKTIFNAHFSHTAIQSPMAKAFFQSLDNTYSVALTTGPLLYARTEVESNVLKQDLLSIEHTDKKIIMHAGTPKSDRSMRPWVYETNDEYVRNINDLIEAVGQLENAYLVIRFRPSEELDKDTLLQLIRHSEHCGVYSEGDFTDYLSIADVLVSYSSTTIEEALQNNVPVLQYDHDDKYMHVEAPTADHNNFKISPIYYCGQQGNLSRSIKLILENLEPIQSDQAKWEAYRYPIDAELSWLDELYKYDQFKPIQ